MASTAEVTSGGPRLRPASGPSADVPDVYVAMNALAARTGAINLGQGVPPGGPPAEMTAAAIAALQAGLHQYAPSIGLPALREQVAQVVVRSGVEADPDTEITICAGATEALAAALMATVEPGAEVLMAEPFYDAYPTLVAMAGGTLRAVAAVDAGFDLDRLAEAITPRTRVLLINSPHNPTGALLSAGDLDRLADLAQRHDLIVISDEVYQELSYQGPHLSPAAHPGLRARTIVCSSATKMLSVSGWRVGWAVAPGPITARLRHYHRFISFCAPTPLQHATVVGLRTALASDLFEVTRERIRGRRDDLVAALRRAGFTLTTPGGGIVLTARVPSQFAGQPDQFVLAQEVARCYGIVGLPLTTFYSRPGAGAGALRFSFAVEDDSMSEAVRRIDAGAEGGPA
jgi:N-succinyldiaminopimelate aminotransferase